MAGVPPLPQSYLPIFENYWQQLEGSSRGEVNALTAANFLKKSQLKEQFLHKIWDLSDPRGKGYLDKQGFFIALRLVAACQCGRDVALTSIQMSDPPPKFIGVDQTVWTIDGNERAMYNANFERLQPINGLLSGEKIKSILLTTQLPREILGKIWHLSDIDRDGSLDADEFAVAMKLVSLCKKGEALPSTLPHSLVPATKAARIGIAPPTTVVPSPDPVPKKTPASDWVITPEIQAKYDTYFEGIDKDHDGIVSGDEARGILMSSNLPHTVLAHIWNLCDTSKTGKLNKQQFALAMYLIAEKVKGRELPNELPPHLMPPSQRSPSPATGIKAGMRNVRTSPSISPSSSDLFQTSHSSGSLLMPTSSTSTSTPNVFPVPTTSLSLTMSSSSPSLLQPSSTSSLVPTSSATILQPTSTAGNMLQPSNSATTLQPTTGAADFGADFSAIKELDGMTSEIDSIRKEKQSLQQDVMVKQELLQKGKNEVTTLTAELEESTRQRDQLEKQKRETQAQIEEIDNQRSKMESDIHEVKRRCEEEREEIKKLREQLKECEEDKSRQQQQLQKLQQTLQELQKEETGLKTKVESARNELIKIQSESRTVDENIGQVQNHIEQLRVEQDQYTAQMASLSPSTGSNSVISELPEGLTAPNLGEHDAISARATAGSSSPVSSISGFSGMSHPEEERDRTETLTTMNIPTLPEVHDPFASFTDPFTNTTGESSGSVGNTTSFDPFGVFKSDINAPSSSVANNISPFAAFTTMPFSVTTAASTNSTTTSGFANFASMDSSTTSAGTSDPFSSSDPFASAATPKATSQSTWSGSGGFGSQDPFASSQGGSTDPFASTDLFGGDPFGANNPFSSNATTNNSSGFGTDPFAAPP